MKRWLVGIVLVFALAGSVSAQEGFFGFSGSAAYVFNLATQTIDADTALFSPGLQLGARDLLGPLGLRVTGEYSVYPYRGVLELGADALLNIGTAIDPYVGVGVGLAGEGGVSLALARLVGGIAPRLDEGYGLFAEAVLTGYGDLSGSGHPLGYAFKARGGINFYF